MTPTSPVEITVLGKGPNQYVRIGYLEETGRTYYHIRFIEGALGGNMDPSTQVLQVPIADVEVQDGWRFDLLADYLAQAGHALQWQSQRQETLRALRDEHYAKAEKAIEAGVRRWERTNPLPTVGSLPTEILSAAADGATAVTHEPEPEPIPDPDEECTECGMLNGDHTVDCSMSMDLESLISEDEPATPGRWEINDSVVVADTGEAGQVVKISDAVDDNVTIYVSVEGAYPREFNPGELLTPARAVANG
jgi:hypothetical protein